MRKHAYGSKPWLVIITLYMILITALNGYSIYLLRFITDYGLAREMDKLVDVAIKMLIILALLLILELIGTPLRSLYLSKSMVVMKQAYIDRVLDQDITQVQKEQVNRYLSNLTNDFDRYELKFIKNLMQLIFVGLRFGMSVVLLAMVHWGLVVVAMVLLLVFVKFTSRTSKPVQKTEAKKSASLEAYTDFVNESLQGFEIIKQHQLEAERYEAFHERAVAVQDDNYKVDVKTTQVDALNNLVQTLVMFTLIGGGILVARSTSLSLGSLIVIVSSFGNAMWPLSEFSPLLSQMKGISQVLIDFEKNLTRPVYHRPIRVQDFNELVFDQNDLGYPDEEGSILNGVDLSIKAGEKVLIVGRSGSGKSTLLKTIRQSLVPKKGFIYLNQNDIQNIDPHDYHRLFSTVDQIGFIFNGSVKDNLDLYQAMDPIILEKAMHQVGLESLDLNQKLINNGSNLSGGQRARLMLARALCLDSSIILCDEIFANLEYSIAKSIEKDLLEVEKTLINVSHIIFKESLGRYDRIFIVEEGKVQESHDLSNIWSRMLDEN